MGARARVRETANQPTGNLSDKLEGRLLIRLRSGKMGSNAKASLAKNTVKAEQLEKTILKQEQLKIRPHEW